MLLLMSKKAENKSYVPWWIKINDVSANQQSVRESLKRTLQKTQAQKRGWKETL